MDPAEPPTQSLFVDYSSSEAGSNAGIVLQTPEGHRLNMRHFSRPKISKGNASQKALSQQRFTTHSKLSQWELHCKGHQHGHLFEASHNPHPPLQEIQTGVGPMP